MADLTLTKIYSTGHLPSHVKSLLLTQPQKKWIGILDKCKKGDLYLAQLFKATVNVPGLNDNKPLQTLSKALDSKLSHKKKLLDDAKSIYKEAVKTLKWGTQKNEKSKDAAPAKATPSPTPTPAPQPAPKKPAEDMSPTRGIPNVGNTCYLATVLQHLRNTNSFESILNGPIHGFASEAELQRLTKLQNSLKDVVTDLRNPNVPRVAKEKLTLLVNCLVECKMIERASIQYDSSELLTKLNSRLGQAPEAVRIDRLVRYSDESEEYRDRVEMSNYIPLQTSKNGQTTTQLLAAYFGQTPGRTVRFDVSSFWGGRIAQLDGGTGRIAAIQRLGNDATEAVLIAEQVAYIKEQHRNAHGIVKVELTSMRYSQNKVASLPPMIQLRINSIGGKAVIEDRISLAPHLRNPLPDGQNADYVLDVVMCRSGELPDPTAKDPAKKETGGHFWYYKKENGIWTRYDDLNVTQPSQEVIAKEFRESGYVAFYNKV